MNRIEVPIFIDAEYLGEQPLLNSDETAISIFYNIDGLSIYFNEDRTEILGTEINCRGAMYYTPISIDELDKKIMYNNQEL